MHHSMGPLREPYHLRSRGRVAGQRLLRSRKPYHRGRPMPQNDCPAAKKNLRGNRRVESKDPSALQTGFDLVGFERRLAEDLAALDAYVEPPERIEDLHKRLEATDPYPLWAMEHYNKNQSEGEQYMVSKMVSIGICRYFTELGFVRAFQFEAQPSSLDKPDPSATMRFFAQVHEMPDGENHVECYLYPGPLKSGKPYPVSCKVCGLENEDEFNSQSLKLSKNAKKAAKARKLAGEEDPDLDDGNNHEFNSCNCADHRPVGKAGKSSLRGRQKFQAKASNKAGKS